MKKFVLFDLDNTLADTLHLKTLRDARRWAAVYLQIQTVTPFAGAIDLWTEIRARKVHLGVVTHSPGTYARRVLARIGLAPDTLIAYHDLNGKRKPLPYGYQRACAPYEPRYGIAIGDERNDLMAADALGCLGVFAGWSRDSVVTAAECEQAGWVYAAHPNDILAIVDGLPEPGEG